jgi:hypothetical protein
LDAYAANDLSVNGTRLILQEEIAFKQRKVWRHGEKSLALMHEGRNLENRIGIEVYQLNLIVMQDVVKEFVGGEVEATLEEGRQDYDFIRIRSRDIFPLCRSPLDHGTVKEKVFVD